MGSISYMRENNSLVSLHHRTLSVGSRGEPCKGGMEEPVFLTCFVSLMTVLSVLAFNPQRMEYSWLQQHFFNDTLTL